MTKSIEQRLQSRISRRRNFIRFMEEDAAGMKMARLEIRRFFDATGLPVDMNPVNENIQETRKTLKELAADQKLDKALKNMVVMVGKTRRYYGLSDF